MSPLASLPVDHSSIAPTLDDSLNEAPNAQEIVLITNVYGPTGSGSKAGFFQELRNSRQFSRSLWVALGDFNVLLSLQDKNGSPSNISDILAFREAISDMGLFDLPLQNKTFTWSNGRRNPTLERLDRALISQD
uniref:Endonuclease/exonuclease/phosphatase domain-containing protein n=1 Tax=Ananas comosus var. bracteatus TaxID=296719 RepID=A0A6V7PYF4_ANACO|nr:unnamed protein product [Ananas comosus var. bracteatus]